MHADAAAQTGSAADADDTRRLVGDDPPIGDYAALGDGRTAALVSRSGSIDWLCLPHFGSAALFAALLDRVRGGHFAVRPTAEFRATRRYVGDTNVLETRFETSTGTVLVTDSLILPSARDELRPRTELLRSVRGVEGAVEVAIEYEPRGDFGRARGRIENRGELGWVYTFAGEVCFLRSEVDFERRGAEGLGTRRTVAAGDRFFVSLAYTRHDIAVVPALGEAAARRLEDTRRAWQDWADACSVEGEYRDAIVRSALVLKLLHFDLSGLPLLLAPGRGAHVSRVHGSGPHPRGGVLPRLAAAHDARELAAAARSLRRVRQSEHRRDGSHAPCRLPRLEARAHG
jgi:GH15 family glucan-1,4-alpha-glucosidase